MERHTWLRWPGGSFRRIDNLHVTGRYFGGDSNLFNALQRRFVDLPIGVYLALQHAVARQLTGLRRDDSGLLGILLSQQILSLLGGFVVVLHPSQDIGAFSLERGLQLPDLSQGLLELI